MYHLLFYDKFVFTIQFLISCFGWVLMIHDGLLRQIEDLPKE